MGGGREGGSNELLYARGRWVGGWKRLLLDATFLSLKDFMTWVGR